MHPAGGFFDGSTSTSERQRLLLEMIRASSRGVGSEDKNALPTDAQASAAQGPAAGSAISVGSPTCLAGRPALLAAALWHPECPGLPQSTVCAWQTDSRWPVALRS